MARMDVTEMFHGIAYPGHLHTQDSLQYALEFQFRDTDILVVSFPKSGTTWMQEIVSLVCNRGDTRLCQTVPSWSRAPWLEHYYSEEVLKGLSMMPRVITTHLHYHLLGPAVQDSKIKIIYVSRNPKDVAVSYYHFHKLAKFLPDAGSFEDFLNKFLEGTVHFGSWFDHVRDWSNQTATMKNLLHVTYEELSLDLRGTIERISVFLQCPLEEEQLNNCVKHCTFSSMKENKMVNYTSIDAEIMDHSKGTFMRKGKVGDWKNMFTQEQSQCLENVLKSKMQGCTLEFVWEDPNEEEQQQDDEAQEDDDDEEQQDDDEAQDDEEDQDDGDDEEEAQGTEEPPQKVPEQNGTLD